MKIESIVNHVHTLSCTAAAPRIGANWKEPAPTRERPDRPAKALRKGAFVVVATVVTWFAMFPAFMAVGQCGGAGAAHHSAHQPAHQPAHQSAHPSADQPSRPADRSLCRA